MTHVTCAAGVERLMDYLEGTIPADVRDALDRHVAGCARCAAVIASDIETPRIIREATPLVMPGDVQQSLLAFLRARTKRD